MSEPFLDECVAVLSRTPATLDAMLRGLPAVWINCTEGPETWSPYIVMGHLIHGDLTDWIPRLEIILRDGPSVAFTPFDRFAQFRDSEGKTLEQLLDEFRSLRTKNLEHLRALAPDAQQLQLIGTHPALGPVTARQLLATWTAHDLGHVLQVSRVMAKRFKQEVGPWAEYLSVMR